MYSYITVMSNWLLGYDRYKKIYSKNLLEKSTYKDVFYLLKQDELQIGINKANNLINKINHENGQILSKNKIIKINTFVGEEEINKNTRNGLGWYINRNFINVESVQIYKNDKWIDISVEDLTALSFDLEYKNFKKYSELFPRTLSFLPVARACQARCRFCFSESSISNEQIKKIADFKDLSYWCKKASNSGAERFVITGGGEPTVLGLGEIFKILKVSKKYFDKNVLITNGIFLNENTDNSIKMLKENGLSVLALSCHHYKKEINKNIMGIDTGVHGVIKNISKIDYKNKPKLRLICVLQKSGINNYSEIESYIKFALDNNISQICFKELYVASTKESLYSNTSENKYCEESQVSLKEVIDYAEKKGLDKVSELPWGSPIYREYSGGKVVDIAAYTEPSVGWELFNGIARSWNYMSDNKCYASLEDNKSVLEK